MRNNKSQSIFKQPENFVLRLYNHSTENQRSISFDLFESFLNYKKTGLLVIKENTIDEFMSDNDNKEFIDILHIETIDGKLKNYKSGSELDIDEFNNNQVQGNSIILGDRKNSNIYELSINDGVIEVNNISIKN